MLHICEPRYAPSAHVLSAIGHPMGIKELPSNSIAIWPFYLLKFTQGPR